jgi:predicted TIM-barrel fold metal-dependent hydrolase
MARAYRLISADSHLEIVPERWTMRVPKPHRDRAPRLVKLPTGGDGVLSENTPLYAVGLGVAARPYEEHRVYGVTYEGNAGTGTPEQRLAEQDQDGVDAEVMFTSTGNAVAWRNIKDDNAYRAVVHAWNEFLAEEYCVVDRDRLLAMGQIPMTSVADAVAELEYCARAGLKGVCLANFPSGKGYPSPEDDRFYAAILDLEMPLTVHVGFVPNSGPIYAYARRPPEPSVAVSGDPMRALCRFGGGIAQVAIQMIFGGVFNRFPDLRVYFAETMAGWVGYCYEELDDTYRRIRYWAERDYGMDPRQEPPSDVLRAHCLWGFLRDPFGVRHRHEAGVRSMMWGSDFPHYVTDWPNSRRILDEMFVGVPDEERYQITCANAVEFFHLETADAPAPVLTGASADTGHRRSE